MASLSTLLRDFSEQDEKVSPVSGANPFASLRKVRLRNPVEGEVLPEPNPSQGSVPDSVDHHAEAIRAAVEAACAEEREAAENRLIEALEAQKARFEEKFQAEREAWTLKESGVIAERFGAALVDLENVLSERIANVLRPVMLTSLRDKSIAATKAVLSSFLSETSSRMIKIQGPTDLLDDIRKSLGDQAAAFEFVKAETVDVSIVADDIFIETQLTSWAEQLAATGNPE
ncbi:hypothetical protein [Microvirga sp. 2TAF3]|uniref:hypothetical protein n=1 Tax=Microvirga sp. 2TAF3 TaxID=3233014 RepID=UPI003F962830